MVLDSGKIIARDNWYLIPMVDTVIASVNTLLSNQPKILTFTDMHGCLNVDVETPGLGANSDECVVEFPRVDSELEEENM